MFDADHPFERRGDRLILHIRVTPKASRTRIGGVQPDASGRRRLKLSVTAPPEDGKANLAVLRLLSKITGSPRSRLAIIAGETDRNKQIELLDAEALDDITGNALHRLIALIGAPAVR